MKREGKSNTQERMESKTVNMVVVPAYSTIACKQ